MRWRELQTHVGAPAAVMAGRLGIDPKQWTMMVLGIDPAEDMVVLAAKSFRVTECWLRGHTTELPIADTCAAWATCADCRTTSEASP